ncbi:MAG TPA: helix-turn-helix domain-containing protein [Acidimicrobiales bacterium]|nr:helix-turn-helix domain-containing protein [Acidimicrobiales bacterium]
MNPNDINDQEEKVQKLLLTPVETARLLGIGRTKVYELMAAGALKSVRIGRARRVPTDAVDAFLSDLRNAADWCA